MPFRPPERIFDALLENSEAIEVAFDAIVSDSFTLAATSNGGKLHEVPAFSALFFRGLPEVEVRLNRILNPSRIKVTVSGIFCHKTPIVAYSGGGVTGSCELSDLTFISTYGAKLTGGGIAHLHWD
jgi:hypothetical protein